MSHKDAFFKYFCPVLVLMFAVCLVLNECHKTERNEMNVEIIDLKAENDSLRKANESLKLANQKLQADKERYIKLDVTSVIHRRDSVVVNNNFDKVK